MMVARVLLADATFAKRLTQEGDLDRFYVFPAPAVIGPDRVDEILIDLVNLVELNGLLLPSDDTCVRVGHVGGLGLPFAALDGLAATCSMSNSSMAFASSALMHSMLSAHEVCCM